jgi:hypothetical protein
MVLCEVVHRKALISCIKGFSDEQDCCTCSGRLLADFVAKVPNCSALILLLLKNPTDDH